jgi:hypothetical protein
LVCFGVVFLEGLAIYGIMPFIGELLRSRDAGGLREAGFVIGGLGMGGLLYAFVVPLILKVASRLGHSVGGGWSAEPKRISTGLVPSRVGALPHHERDEGDVLRKLSHARPKFRALQVSGSVQPNEHGHLLHADAFDRATSAPCLPRS